MLFLRQNVTTASLRKNGWHSHWQMERGTRAYLRICSIFLTEKLETPRWRTSPLSTSASIACQVSLMDGVTSSPRLPVIGQWMSSASR